MSGSGRILITGANGFVGRHLASALVRANVPVTLAVRDEGSIRPDWREFPAARVVVTGDLADGDITGLLEDASGVVHTAGIAQSNQGAERLFAANVLVTRRLVEAARRARLQSFVFLSSIFAVTPNAAPETVNDATRPAPASAYGKLKLESEQDVGSLAESGIFGVSLRPPLVIGADAGGNWRSLLKLAATGLPLPFASVAAQRSYLWVEDLANAIVRLVTGDWPVSRSGAYCISNLEPLALPEVVRELRAGMNIPARLFGVPSAAFGAIGALTGRRQMAASLTGGLRVDAGRFSSTFGFSTYSPLRAAIRRSGAEYVAAERR